MIILNALVVLGLIALPIVLLYAIMRFTDKEGSGDLRYMVEKPINRVLPDISEAVAITAHNFQSRRRIKRH